MVELQCNYNQLKKIAKESETFKKAAKEKLVLLKDQVWALENATPALLSDKKATMKELAKMKTALEQENDNKNELFKRSKKAEKAIEKNVKKCWASGCA